MPADSETGRSGLIWARWPTARVRLLAMLLLTASATGAQPVVAEGSCTQTAGAKQARIYVQQCLQVSPATRPPCNAENPCVLITDEIKRGCGMLAKDAPAFCRAIPTRR